MRRVIALVAALALFTGAAGCSGTTVGSLQAGDGTTAGVSTTIPATTGSTATSASAGSQTGTVAAASEALTLAYDLTDLDATWDDSSSSFITLTDGAVRFDGAGGTANGNKVTIESAGTYVVSGSSSDAQIVVDSEEHGLVRLVLNGADLTCTSSAPIYVKNAEKVVLILADGTKNSVTDGTSYTLDADATEPNAAIFSKADLTINGNGALTVTANYNDGIVSKDELRIVSGQLDIQAKNDALKGKDCLGVKDGAITVVAGGDGLQSTNDLDASKGFISISGGTLNITSQSDGIEAQTTLLVTAGDVSLVTGGGSSNGTTHSADFGPGGRPGATTASTAAIATDMSDTAASSAKGLKAAAGVFVEGGTVSIDSADDSLHSNGAIEIKAGTITLASGDDALHAGESVTIDGGDLSISACYEGIESNAITLNDGTVRLVSSDDAINGVSTATADTAAATATTATTAAGAGNSGTGTGAGFPGETGNAALTINGGYLAVDAGGDGLDINGTITMTAGTVVVNGPTNDGNGAIDYLSEFKITGGFLVAAGSAGMAEAPSDSSTQYSIMVNFSSAQAAGTLVHIEDQAGNDILTVAPTKQYQSVVVCSPDIKKDATYTVFLGGTSSGAVSDTVYEGGAYAGGAEYATLTTSSVVTVSGSAGGMRGGGPGGR